MVVSIFVSNGYMFIWWVLMKILVVEDSIHLRESIQLGLSKFGFVVDSAEDGQVGLSFIESYEYDVILLDIMMPKINGLDLLNIIRERQINSAVIMLTSKDGIHDRVTGLQMGADDYLCKPFAFKELVARINTVSRRYSLTEKVKIQIGQLFFDFALKKLELMRARLTLHLLSMSLSSTWH